MSVIQPANTFLKDLPVTDPENFSRVNKDSKLLKIRPKIIHDVEIGDNEKRIQVDKVPMLLRYLKNHWNINNPTDQKEEIRNGQKRLATEHPTHRINNETLVDGQIRRSFSNHRISDNDVEIVDEHLQQGPSTSNSSNKRDEASSSTVGNRASVNRTHKRERRTRALVESDSDEDSQSRQNLRPSTSVTRERNISDSSSDIPTKSRRRS
ncbi:det1 complexing ubiquitin ligase domain-containing protein [Ditylenchus destructor]|uniref:Det1 complexing ubiquitin ligase domain-containing protein n=1 Tax=Ditylenchus destructor TaxID=166010 RepID=A0AAD4NL14_9BILA|nr:det1 complexing ubiquitin ligase domain-containing protein [Ditylenchus destructor]